MKVSVRSFLPWSDACVFLSAHPWGGHLVRPIGPSIDRLSFFSFSYGSDSIGKRVGLFGEGLTPSEASDDAWHSLNLSLWVMMLKAQVYTSAQTSFEIEYRKVKC